MLTLFDLLPFLETLGICSVGQRSPLAVDDENPDESKTRLT